MHGLKRAEAAGYTAPPLLDCLPWFNSPRNWVRSRLPSAVRGHSQSTGETTYVAGKLASIVAESVSAA